MLILTVKEKGISGHDFSKNTVVMSQIWVRMWAHLILKFSFTHYEVFVEILKKTSENLTGSCCHWLVMKANFPDHSRLDILLHVVFTHEMGEERLKRNLLKPRVKGGA